MQHDKSNQRLTATDTSNKMPIFDKDQTPTIGYLQHNSFIKLFLLNLLTFNIYRFYWFYENWDAIRILHKSKFSPISRALAPWSSIHPLFKRIYKDAKYVGYEKKISYSLLATFILVLKSIIPILTVGIFINIAKHAVDGTSIRTLAKLIDSSLSSRTLLLVGLIGIADLLFWPIQKAINFYNARLAEMQVVLPPSASSDVKYFEVSCVRFVIMSILTLSLYFMYWQYKNWQAIKRADRSRIWPFWRVVFFQFFIHILFKRIFISAKGRGYNKSVHYLGLAAVRVVYPVYTSVILIVLLRFALLKLNLDFLGVLVVLYKPFVDVANQLLSLLLAIPINYFIYIPIHKALLYYNSQAISNHQPRKGFTVVEIILAIVGILFYGSLIVISYYLLE